jgi:hypothetical protein
MKKFIAIIVLGLLWCNPSFAEKFKVNMQCTLFIDNEYFAKKTWLLDNDKKSGYLNFVNDSIVEWHESIPIENDEWLVMFYHVDRFSGVGVFDATGKVTNRKFLKWLDQVDNPYRSLVNSITIMDAKKETSGTVECEAVTKKAF